MKRDILILLVISSVVLLFNLGAGSLSSWDEAFYAQVSREIVQSNNWIDLTWGGGQWSDKPPLYMWGTAVFYKIFGVNEFSARLFSALSGIALVILTYLFAARLFSRRAGMISAIMLVSTYHFIWFSKMGTLDVTLALFVLLSIYFFMRAEEDRRNIIYSFVWFGLAFLTKGAGAFLIPVILGLYVLARREWGLIFNRYTAAGILIFAVMAGSWYFIEYQRFGQSVIKGHFLQHLINRTTSVMDSHQGNWLTYINVVLYKGKPWGTLGLIALPFFVFYTVRQRRPRNYLLICWIIITFLIFTIVRTKLHWYIIPVYPAVIMVAGWGMDKALKRGAITVTVLVSLASVLYFGMKKDVFTLDFNHNVKNFHGMVIAELEEGQKVYLYDIQDPGMRFYFGDTADFIQPDQIDRVQKGRKGAVIVVRTVVAKNIRGEVIASDPGSDYIAKLTK